MYGYILWTEKKANMKPFIHQTATTKFILATSKCLITSDPGTGKTRSVLDAYVQRKTGRLLVIAPLSILQASWGDDIEKFQPNLTYSIAYAKNREAAFQEKTDVVMTNHDAVKWLIKHPRYLKDFDTICIDEFTAFKNRTSQRSKALAKFTNLFKYRIAMSGTPNTNTIRDIWHPVKLLDDGERLGRSFYKFQSEMCINIPSAFTHWGEWEDRPDAEERVSALIGDINIRYRLEDCIDMPKRVTNTLYVTLPKKIYNQYIDLQRDSVLYTKSGTINAIHAGAKVKKLLQLCTGAVYNQEGEVLSIHKDRYNLIIDLVAARKHSLVAFNWTHEKNYLTQLADKLNISYAVIDGSAPANKRGDIVRQFQAGQLQVLFCHPQSAGHGLTLTKATTVIWASPTYNAEHYQQLNGRIYRAGQKKRTEIIQIAAKYTWEIDVYKKLDSKLNKMEDLLNLLDTYHQFASTG